ncbi:MAG: DUF167 domain-containing protein [Nanoarchaeota archaeon]|nr:DUF167 domain-containing protein [Nanoarchaeota archaeon]
MIIELKVKTNQKEQAVNLKDGKLIVSVKSKPVKKRANEELIKLLQDYYKKKVRIISGAGSRKKMVEIL